VALLVALSLSGTLRPRELDAPRVFPWDEAAAHVLARASPADALVVSHPAGIVPFEHYARAHPRRADAPELTWPSRGDAHVLRTPPLPDMRERVLSRRRVWFVLFGEQAESRALRDELESKGYRRAEDLDLEGVRILLLER
jgi:hypothetical protein